ncbi:MAG TPA: hypothetical protein VF014_09140 [Casimicrobiaceae bacterium]|nr:hypothetical protein [Casimicrobiaceae bacterium]
MSLIAHHVSDPSSAHFGKTSTPDTATASAAVAPIQNKIGKALMVPSLRNMLAQPSSTITLRRLMDEGAIVICNLSKGSSGESTANLLGALITTALAQAALSRADTAAADRRVFHLYADEFQSFAKESLRSFSRRPASTRPPSRSATNISTSSPTSCDPRCLAMPDRSSPAAPVPRTP